jgi:hypothetical protein
MIIFVFFTETLKKFKANLLEDPESMEKIKALRTAVETFARSFPMPGNDDR